MLGEILKWLLIALTVYGFLRLLYFYFIEDQDYSLREWLLGLSPLYWSSFEKLGFVLIAVVAVAYMVIGELPPETHDAAKQQLDALLK